MNSESISKDQIIFNKAVHINASASLVWRMLTTPELMKTWMMPDIELEILTDWNVESLMITRGVMNGKQFENKGVVLQFEPEKTLAYTHLSSISRLPDQPASYTLIKFDLESIENQTQLSLTISNFPTESIYKHMAFYWNVTLEVLKKMIEEQGLVE